MVLLPALLDCYQWIICHLQDSGGIYQTDLSCNLLPPQVYFWVGFYLCALLASDGVLLRLA